MSGSNFEVPPLSRAQIRNVMQELRDVVPVSGTYFPIMEFVEFALVDEIELQVHDEEEMGANHGLSIPSLGILQLRSDVYYGAWEGKGRDRLTVAHELGHIILHRDVTFARAMGERGEIPAYRDSEWQANCAAGELLMDKRLWKPSMSEEDMMAAFGVSSAAASKQRSVFEKELGSKKH